MSDETDKTVDSSLQSYFQQTPSSIFDQISTETDKSQPVDGADLLSSENAVESFTSESGGGYQNPGYSLDIPSNDSMQSPQPAVLTPGVGSISSQASTPFKEIDSSQVDLLSQKVKTDAVSKKITDISPEVDLESTIVKFSQTNISDTKPTVPEPNIPKAYSPTPPKTLQTNPPLDSNKKDAPNYFTRTFDTTRTINQSNTSLSDSAMMNPIYMSPTEGFNISQAIPSPDSFLTPATEQDVFTASLLSSDADRRHDAWIPSESTKAALTSMATCPPGTYFPEKEMLTMPGIAVKEDFGDPVRNLVRTYLGEEAASKRQVLTSTSVTQDDRGIRQLISAGCYHAAVNLTTQLLTVYGQGEGRAGHPSKHTAHSIQLWFTRLALLMKLRRFSLAEVESQFFKNLDAPDLYFQFYPELYGGRKGSMVPFSFRILVAELPQYLGKHTQALDRLNALLRTCDQIVSNLNEGLSEDGSPLEMSTTTRDDSLKLWRTRRLKVLYSLTSCAASMKDFRLAGHLIRKLLHEDLSSTAGLYSALGRLCLQLGDIHAAEEAFKRHLEHSPPPPHHDPVQGLLHSAYLACAQNNFKDAVQILQQAHKINPNNGLVVSNLGVCLMYTGDIKQAIHIVESAVLSHPERFLHEAVVLNLVTMYELESSNSHDNKLKLLNLVLQYKGDGFNVAALKLQSQLA